MKRYSLLSILFFGVLLCSCFGSESAQKSLIGEWGMVSGGVEKHGVFAGLEHKDDYYKTMEFREDGSFTEICGELVANGTYEVVNSQRIKYSYIDAPGGGPEYFVIHRSGSWTYYFFESDAFTLYDYSASPSLEVSMTFKRISAN